MKKRFLIITLLSCVGIGAVAKPAWKGRPAFEGDYIKMRIAPTKLGRCGGATIEPKGGNTVRLLSRLFAKASWFGRHLKPGPILSKGWVEIPPGGLRTRYGRASSLPKSAAYYGVYCQRKNEWGNWDTVPCSEVVKLQDVQHNRPCIRGILGPNATHSQLNMQISK